MPTTIDRPTVDAVELQPAVDAAAPLHEIPVTFQGALWLSAACALAGLGYALYVLATGAGDDRAMYLAVPGAAAAALLARYCVRTAFRLRVRFIAGPEGLHVLQPGRAPELVPWRDIATVRQRAGLQRLDVRTADGRAIGLEYQLTDFDALAEAVVRHAPASALGADAADPGVAHGPGGVDFRSGHIGPLVLPLAALIIGGSVMMAGGVLLVAYAGAAGLVWAWLSGWRTLRLEPDALVVQRAFRDRRIAASHVVDTQFALEPGAKGSRHAAVYVLLSSGEVLRFAGVRGGEMALQAALAAWHRAHLARERRPGARASTLPPAGPPPAGAATGRKLRLPSLGLVTMLGVGAGLLLRPDAIAWAPLHVAAVDGSPAAVSALVRAGANPEVLGLDERRPLHVAAKHGRTASVRTLLDHGAAIEGRNREEGFTALHVAAEQRHLGVMRLLIERGAKVDARSASEQTPLHQASWQSWHGDAEAARMLVARGADVNARDDEGFTPLMRAAGAGNTDVVHLLARSGADLHAVNDDGASALRYAVRRGSVNGVTALIQAGAAIDARGEKGRTALHLAVSRGDTTMVALLLRLGADPNVQSETGQTPLFAAAYDGNARIAALLLAGGANPDIAEDGRWTPLVLAANRNHAAMIRVLIAGGAPVEDTPRGFPPLYYAAREGHLEAARVLLEAGANPDGPRWDRSPARQAELRGHDAIVELMRAFRR